MFFNNISNSKDDSLYKLLEVSRDANETTIKKSYRKLALKHHPDRNKDNKEEAENKFKEISSAYEILSNKEKRQMYDTHGLDALKNSGGSGINPFDIFNNLFTGEQGGHFFGGNMNRQQQNKPRVETINVSLEDIYKESTLKIKINKNIISSGSSSKQCSTCDGQGRIIQMRSLGPGLVTQSATTCNKCNGIGKIVKMEKEVKIIDVKLNNKYVNGSKIIIKDEGHEQYNKYSDSKSDLILIIEEEKHNYFIRDNNNLIFNTEILLSDALCGSDLIITHLDERKLLIKTNEIITPKTKKRIIGEGINPSGDLIINFSIIFPTILSSERKQYISKILPRNNRPPLNLDDYEIKISEDYDISNSDNNLDFDFDSKEHLFEDNECESNISCNQQ
jgi:DnaJ homolog subfamily A member 2